MLTADGSDDEVSPEGLKDNQVMPPLPIAGPPENPDEEVPEPAPNPKDTIIEDELFASDKSKRGEKYERSEGKVEGGKL